VKVKVYPADRGGCGMYRCGWPGEALAAAGSDVEVIYGDAPVEHQIQATWWTDDSGERRMIDVKAPDADVVVIQRPLTDTLACAVAMLQARGVKVVVEVDDDFEAISPRNVSWRDVHPGRSPRRNRDHLRRACELADLVVVSTPALAARYGAHGRVVVVPNCVPERYLGVTREPHEGVFVGWSGSLDTHPDDLQVTGGGVARAVRKTGATFAVVGTGRGVRRALGLDADPLAAGWVPIDAYPGAVAQLDVGIVPLELTPFNEAKSALKMLEMAAVGVPSVVSPTAENVRMAAELGQVVASSPRGWEGIVKRLVSDDAWRRDRAEAGREAMRRHTIEGRAEQWLDAWSLPVCSPVNIA
jgi:glycosyltransferase involved in cell wall biosynthesis